MTVTVRSPMRHFTTMLLLTTMTTAESLLLIYTIVVHISVSFGETVWGLNSPVSAGLGPTRNKVLEDVLDTAERDSHAMASRTTPLPMQYSIFRGKSAVRELPESDRCLVDPDALFDTKSACPLAAHRACAVLLLLRGHADAAHDVILGVTRTNLETAEYAATHRGETNWTQEHPLTDSADLIHAALHRLEGSLRGEGNYTGYENSKYWLAGGPKALEVPAIHPARTELVKIARERAPCCVEAGVIAEVGGADHIIIADGGKMRRVCVPEGEWDGFVFVDFCQQRECGKLTKEQTDEVSMLTRAELVLLLRSELEECL